MSNQPPDCNDNLFEIEKVIGSKQVNGQTLYKVLWQGYPLSEATWEPYEHFIDDGALNCIEKFLKQQKAKKKVNKRGNINFVVDYDDEEDEREQQKIRKEKLIAKTKKPQHSTRKRSPRVKPIRKVYRLLSSDDSDDESLAPEVQLSENDFNSSAPKRARLERQDTPSPTNSSVFEPSSSETLIASKKKNVTEQKTQKVDSVFIKKKMAEQEHQRKPKKVTDLTIKTKKKLVSKPSQTPVNVLDELMALPLTSQLAFSKPSSLRKLNRNFIHQTPPRKSSPSKSNKLSVSFCTSPSIRFIPPNPRISRRDYASASTPANKEKSDDSPEPCFSPLSGLQIYGKPESRIPHVDKVNEMRFISSNSQVLSPHYVPNNSQHGSHRPPSIHAFRFDNASYRRHHDLAHDRLRYYNSGPPRVHLPVITTRVDFEIFKRYIEDCDYSKISSLREIPREYFERSLDVTGNTLLHRLAAYNTPEAIEILRMFVNKFDANVNFKNTAEDSLLHVALRTVEANPFGYFKNDMVFAILELNADPNCPNHFNEYPLFLAYKKVNNVAAIRLIIKGANPAAVLMYERNLAVQQSPFYVRDKILREFVQLDQRQLNFTFGLHDAHIIASSVYVESYQPNKQYMYEMVIGQLTPESLMNDIFIFDFGILKHTSEARICLSRPETSIIQSVFLNDVSIPHKSRSTCRLAFDATEVVRTYFNIGTVKFVVTVTFNHFTSSLSGSPMVSSLIQYHHRQ